MIHPLCHVSANVIQARRWIRPELWLNSAVIFHQVEPLRTQCKPIGRLLLKEIGGLFIFGAWWALLCLVAPSCYALCTGKENIIISYQPSGEPYYGIIECTWNQSMLNLKIGWHKKKQRASWLWEDTLHSKKLVNERLPHNMLPHGMVITEREGTKAILLDGESMSHRAASSLDWIWLLAESFW